ncbi:MAG: hypothetical protein A3J60_02595 [Candidatus Pacebacteria bacterium RIFCSPHIGHO2_02_FULL_46_9]|nr:MAG: hypothetical protein A3J60_02595 [Candidatus Pacebacteria bacterium RIFCSPHIGHO2_02_FULL_46_9]
MKTLSSSFSTKVPRNTSDKFEMYQETLALQQDTELMKDIKAGQTDIAAKNFTSHEEMKKQLLVNSAPCDQHRYPIARESSADKRPYVFLPVCERS